MKEALKVGGALDAEFEVGSGGGVSVTVEGEKAWVVFVEPEEMGYLSVCVTREMLVELKERVERALKGERG